MTIRNIDYEITEDPETVLSRLTWAVEKVEGLLGQLMSGVTVDTNRPWVGVYDKEKMEFGLIESGGFLGARFLQVIVQGQIRSEGGNTRINVRLKLSWYPLFVSTVIYAGTIGMLIMAAVFGQLSDIGNLILWIIVFPVLWTMILKRKIDKVEKKVEDLLGVG